MKDRREFLLRLGIGSGVAALGAQTVASMRSLVPNVSYDSPTTVKIGMPNDFPDGLQFLPDQRLYVFRDGKTFHAISAVCTHLECIVQYRDDTKQIWCACHNGQYNLSGKNIGGPPPRPLEEYKVNTRGDDVVVTRG